MTVPKKAHVRATFAALYAIGAVVPPEGIPADELKEKLGGHLDADTFDGLLKELQRRQVLTMGLKADVRTLLRAREYTDGLERIRLTSVSLRD